MMGEARIEFCRLSDAGPRNGSGNETNGWGGHQALGRAGGEPCRAPGPGDGRRSCFMVETRMPANRGARRRSLGKTL